MAYDLTVLDDAYQECRQDELELTYRIEALEQDLEQAHTELAEVHRKFHMVEEDMAETKEELERQAA